MDEGVPADGLVAAHSPGGDFGKSRWQLSRQVTRASAMRKEAVSAVGRWRLHHTRPIRAPDLSAQRRRVGEIAWHILTAWARRACDFPHAISPRSAPLPT